MLDIGGILLFRRGEGGDSVFLVVSGRGEGSGYAGLVCWVDRHG